MSTGYDYISNTISVKFAQAEQPKFREFKGANKYIAFGEYNNYPEYLLSLYNESAKHGAITKSKVNYIYGKGFEDVPKNANAEGQSFNKILKRAIVDGSIFSGFYLQVVWNRMQQIAGIYHIDFAKVRMNKDKSEFYIKDDWSDLKEKVRIYPSFNVNNPFGTQIYCYQEYSPLLKTYPLPDYFQALNYIESDVQISRHILGNAKDGFVAGTLINLNNGDPISEENKGEVERSLKKKFTGSEGDRLVIVYNKSKENSAEILPLGQTQLTKEDFTNINKLIEQEIFAGHQITSPQLFGIKTEGQLGASNEIRNAYTIFNNTYVNAKQQEYEEVFNNFMRLMGIQGEYKIQPTEPLGFEFTEAIMASNMTRTEIREKMGLKADAVVTPGTVEQPVNAASNDALRNLSGRQLQGIQRIVRKYNQGQLTKEQAAQLLKAGFNFTDEDVNTWLGTDEDPTTPDGLKFSSEDERFFFEFENSGEDRNLFEVITSKYAREDFAEVKDFSQLESNILDLISKDKRITPEVIADTLNEDVKVVSRIVKELENSGLIKPKIERIGTDEITERELTRPMSEIRKDGKVTTTEVIIRYSYEGPEDDRNRPFCARMIDISKRRMWSRQDIENISLRLGYSVWDRRGGWYTQPDGERRPYCRHDWKSNVVLRKK
jgi:hypothetical protein